MSGERVWLTGDKTFGYMAVAVDHDYLKGSGPTPEAALEDLQAALARRREALRGVLEGALARRREALRGVKMA